jgi:hypothetical protein
MESGDWDGGCGLWHVGGQGINVKNDKSVIQITVGGAIWRHFSKLLEVLQLGEL